MRSRMCGLTSVSKPALHSAFLLACLLVLVGCDRAEQTQGDPDRIVLGPNENARGFGAYTLHVNALTTDQLEQDVAKAYGITRSKSRAMLNVVIMRNAAGQDQPVTAQVSASARNLANQFKDLGMRELVEQDAIYYIGETAVGNEETLIFDVDVIPVDQTETFKIRYRQQFFTQ